MYLEDLLHLCDPPDDLLVPGLEPVLLAPPPLQDRGRVPRATVRDVGRPAVGGVPAVSQPAVGFTEPRAEGGMPGGSQVVVVLRSKG